MRVKQIIFIIILFFVFIQINSQNIELCGEVEYKQATNFSRYFERFFVTKFNTEISYSSEIKINRSNEKIKQNDSNEGRTVYRDIERKNLTSDFFYNTKEDMFFREIYFNKPLLVKEDRFDWNWKLHNKTKLIGNFNCQKATITFRGRNYTAWFTNEIPVPFGPWKFQGLSGLILEVYDNDNVFHLIATNIVIKKDKKCTINIDEDSFEKAMSIKEYNNEKLKLLKEDFAKLSARMPKGYKNLKLDENCEDCKEEIEKFRNEK